MTHKTRRTGFAAGLAIAARSLTIVTMLSHPAGSSADENVRSALITAERSPGSPRLWFAPGKTPLLTWATAPRPDPPNSHFYVSERYGVPLKTTLSQGAIRYIGVFAADPSSASDYDLITSPSGQPWSASTYSHVSEHSRESYGRLLLYAVEFELNAPRAIVDLMHPAPITPDVLVDFPEFRKNTHGATEIRLLAGAQSTPWVVGTTRKEPREVFLVRSKEGKWLAPQVLASGEHPAPVRDRATRYQILYQTRAGISRILSRDGEVWSKPTAVPAAEGGRQPAVTFGAGRLWLVWSAGGEASADLCLASSNDDGATWTTPRQLTSGKAADSEPSILVDKENTVWVAFIRRDDDKKALWTMHFPAAQQ